MGKGIVSSNKATDKRDKCNVCEIIITYIYIIQYILDIIDIIANDFVFYNLPLSRSMLAIQGPGRD